MANRKISQSDARRYRKECDEAKAHIDAILRRGRSAYGGTHIGGNSGEPPITMARLRTAKQLGYALFAIPSDSEDRIDFRAMKPGEG